MDDLQENIYRDTPLHTVRNAQAAEALIGQGADLEARNAYGETPLLAIELNEWDFRNDAQKEGERILGLIETLVSHGADIHAQTGEGSLLHKVAAYFYNGMTLSDEEVEVFEKIIKRLVELGADINQRNEEGDTPLHYAQYNEWQISCTRILLECGADINAQNNYGITPLIKSILEPGLVSRTEFLIEWGADVNLQDAQGWTALHHAAKRNDGSTVASLLKHGAKPDIVNNEGETAAQLGEISGHTGLVRCFKGEPLIGEVDNSESDRCARAELRGRISSFRAEINQTEAVCRAAAKGERGLRWFLIALVPVMLLFSVPGMLLALTILGIILFNNPLNKAVRYETASQMCLALSGELRRMMDSSENLDQLEGKLNAMLLQREQLIRMQDGIFEE